MLCGPRDCRRPGSSIFHYFREFVQIYNPFQWCHPTIPSSVIPFSSCPQSFPTLGSFLISWLFASGDQNPGASATASVLPMNIQSWFPIGLTGLISLLSKELSRPSTTIWKHQFFLLSLLYDPTLFPRCHVWMWELSVDNLKQMENFAILDS